MKLTRHIWLGTALSMMGAFSANAQIGTSELFDPQARTVFSDEAPGWNRMDMEVSWRGSAVPLDDLGKPMYADVIYSADGQAGDVVLTCLNGALGVSVTEGNVDIPKMLTNPPDSRRFKIERPKVEENGTRLKKEDWLWMPSMDMIRARRASSAAKIYNAAIRGSKVTMKLRGETFAVNLPPIDDNFRNFGAACGLGRGAKS